MKKLLIIISLLLPLYGVCEEPSDDLEDEFAWQLSVGAFYVDMTMPELIGTDSTFKHGTFLVDAKIEYKNFYLNTHSGDFFGGSDVGYQIINTGEWGIDAIYGSYMLPFSERGYHDSDDVVPELRGIKKTRSR
ncbi:hypothetical protein [Pseudoalteromonas sp. PS5]|uniref:hypothetical protein n=1 Tax=Pseudoalteromonas sp. PS5 TaxID=1437473 RepID=UPI001F4FCC22|nr:hypothetical protein [Pseudoalteromonas sp. PS5]